MQFIAMKNRDPVSSIDPPFPCQPAASKLIQKIKLSLHLLPQTPLTRYGANHLFPRLCDAIQEDHCGLLREWRGLGGQFELGSGIGLRLGFVCLFVCLFQVLFFYY